MSVVQSALPSPIPVVTIGGYLGAGKTTLVNHLLRQANGRRLAVLVNEFGSLPIDADLIEAQDENMISISGGCVCCSYGNDMVAALEDMAAMAPRPDLVLLEASGVALPGAVRDLIGLLADYRHQGVTVLADAETVRKRAQDTYMGDTILRQLADADLLVLNKADLVAEPALASLRDWLQTSAPAAAIITTSHAMVPLDVIGGLAAGAPKVGHHHHHVEDSFETESFTLEAPADPEGLASALASPAYALVRAKGFVRDGAGTLIEVQTVGRRWDVRPARTKVTPGVVCIGLKGQCDMAGVAALFTRLAEPHPSQPVLSGSAP